MRLRIATVAVCSPVGAGLVRALLEPQFRHGVSARNDVSSIPHDRFDPPRLVALTIP
jgi:hypothetical protein